MSFNIAAGQSRTFTATVQDQLFVVTTNGGAVGSISGAASALFGPNPMRRSFGPLNVGQQLTVAVQVGEALVDYADQSPEVVPPVIMFFDAGGIAAPIATFDGAGTSGKFGLAQNILIPANTLVAGQSRIRVSVTQRKVGAANNFLQIHFGPLNSSGDTMIAASQVSTAGTTPVPSVMIADFSVSSDGMYVNYIHSRTNVGVTTGENSTTSGINLAVDNYLNFVITGSAAGTTNSLLGYTVEVFP